MPVAVSQGKLLLKRNLALVGSILEGNVDPLNRRGAIRGTTRKNRSALSKQFLQEEKRILLYLDIQCPGGLTLGFLLVRIKKNKEEVKKVAEVVCQNAGCRGTEFYGVELVTLLRDGDKIIVKETGKKVFFCIVCQRQQNI